MKVKLYMQSVAIKEEEEAKQGDGHQFQQWVADNILTTTLEH